MIGLVMVIVVGLSLPFYGMTLREMILYYWVIVIPFWFFAQFFPGGLFEGRLWTRFIGCNDRKTSQARLDNIIECYGNILNSILEGKTPECDSDIAGFLYDGKYRKAILMQLEYETSKRSKDLDRVRASEEDKPGKEAV